MNDFCLHETTKAQLWPVLREMLASGKRYRVSIVEWRDKRTLSQNALLWKWYGEIAGQLGKAGTRAEISEAIGCKSPNSADLHLKAIAKKGAIELHPGTFRGIKIIKQIQA